MMLVDKLMMIKESLDIPSEFGTDFDNDDYYQVNEICDNALDENDMTDFFCRVGASKTVFVSERYNYVLKVPFSGYWRVTSEVDEDDMYYDGTGEFVSYENSRSESCWNYCETEEEIYTDAVKFGIAHFFAATEFYGYTPTKYPVYIQSRVTPYFDYRKNHSKEYTKEELTYATNVLEVSRRHTGLSAKWIADAIAAFGEESVLDLLSFIDLRDITDLHMSNYGYTLDGKPIIFDYAGWHERIE